MMASALRSGYSIMQAIETVTREMEAQFRRVQAGHYGGRRGSSQSRTH